jgi:hypothetical protein
VGTGSNLMSGKPTYRPLAAMLPTEPKYLEAPMDEQRKCATRPNCLLLDLICLWRSKLALQALDL